jgi:hypothetical protein
LWDFFSHKEEVPEFVTVLDTSLKIECVKVNKMADQTGEKKDVYYYIVTFENKFKVYYGRLEILLEGEIEN